MKNYELMTISKKALGEEGFETISGLVKEAVSKVGGEVTNSTPWGRRKFAYKIDNETEGFYEVIEFAMPAAKLEALNTRLSLIEGLQRYLVSAKDSK
jgi:small subunit ribosomal protein S6